MRIPLANSVFETAERDYVNECLETGWISSTGRFVRRFEELFSQKLGPGQALSMSNGTVAIHLALEAAGVAPGDEVIVPNLTFAASVSPIHHLRAVPVLAPTARDSWNMDPDAVEGLITERTRAIVVVHLYGVPADLGRIMPLAKRHGLLVIEDCAEAMGASVGGRHVGTYGDAGAFSFFGNKILTTGEGGMCLSSRPEVVDRMRLLRGHGMREGERYWHRAIGYNCRMTNLQAAIGLGQLERLDTLLAARNRIHAVYEEAFLGKEYFFRTTVPEGAAPVVWLESRVLAPEKSLERDRLIEDLASEGVETRPFFHPMGSLPAYRRFGEADRHSSFFSGHGFNLPTWVGLKDSEVREIARLTCRHIERQFRGHTGVTLAPRTPPGGEERPEVSVILPTYNERGNAVRIIERLQRQMASTGKDHEIIVMDDCSADGTVAEIRERFPDDPRIRITVREGKPRGLAASIREGLDAARGDTVIVMDSDFNHDPDITGAMVRMSGFYDLVSGSRFTTGGGMQSPMRWWCSLAFNLWLRIFLMLPTQDNLAGFFCISRKKLLELDLPFIFRGYGDYFLRLLYLSRLRGYSILEIPVWYRDRDYGVSKTPLFKTLMRYTMEAFRLRIYAWGRGRGEGGT